METIRHKDPVVGFYGNTHLAAVIVGDHIEVAESGYHIAIGKGTAVWCPVGPPFHVIHEAIACKSDGYAGPCSTSEDVRVDAAPVAEDGYSARIRGD